MRTSLKFIWIDDDPSRKKSASSLEQQLNVKCTFIDVKKKNVDYIKEIKAINPDLILVDHNLTEIAEGTIKKGSTIAALIRETYPNYAIACITGQDYDNMDPNQRLSYEAVFDFAHIKRFYPTMKSIAMAFRQMRSTPPQDIEHLFKLMKVPKEDKEKLLAILPHEIKDNFNSNGNFSIISHWIRNFLLKRPGFLYDRLWAATLLGFNEDGFTKVEEKFKTAQYSGIFADDIDKKWWKSKLLKILSELVETTGLPWEKGRQLIPSLDAKYYSKDFYSNYTEEYPEVVAFVDTDSAKRVQIKMKYTALHPKYEKLMFFEDVRIMKEPE